MYQNRGGGRGGRGGGFGSSRGGPSGRGRGGGTGVPRAPPTFSNVPIEHAPIIESVKLDIVPKENVPINVNCFPFKTNSLKNVFKYEMTFSLESKAGKTRILSEDIKSDFDRVNVKKIITQLYDIIFSQNEHLFYPGGNKNHIHVFDRINEYYSSVELSDKELNINVDVLPDELRAELRRPKLIKVNIKCIKSIVPNAPSAETDDKIDIEKYIDCLVNQVQLDDPKYYVYGAKTYDQQAKQALDGLSLLDGHHKNSKVMENNNAVLQLEPKKGAFYPSVGVLVFASNMLGFNPNNDLCNAPYPERLTGLLKGLIVQTNYHTYPRRFKVYGCDNRPANQIVIDEKGVSVADYLTRTYNFKLKFPHFPCLVEKKGGVRNYYPIETLVICDGQRVSRNAFTKKQNADMIKLCQMVPTRFLENLSIESKKAGINHRNEYLTNAGLMIDDEAIKSQAKVLFPPQVQYTNTAKQLTFGEWRFDNNDKFVRGAMINRLLFVAVQVPISVCKNFADQLVRRGKEAGMNIVSYDVRDMIALPYDEMAEYMKNVKKEGVDFLFLIGDLPGLHDNLKAAEQCSGLNTEQVKPKTVERTGGSTFENILMKLNLKAGGMNHYLGTSISQLEKTTIPCDIHKSIFDKTLCVGFTITHPGAHSGFEGRGNEPSVLGYSFTTTKSANVTHGGYVYIRPKQTILDKSQVEKAIKHAVYKYVEDAGQWPSRIVIYRGSVIEGEFERLNQYEAICIGRVIRELLQQSDQGKMPSFAMIAISRNHNFRLLKPMELLNAADKAPQQNVIPGTLIDHTVTSEGFEQFIFVAHKGLQGCAKPIVGTVVTQRGEKLTFDVIQQMTYNLCFIHEIVPLSISVPAPIRSAEQLSNRGQRNLIVMGNGSLSGLSDSNEDPEYLNDFYLRLTEKYETKNAHRFWA